MIAKSVRNVKSTRCYGALSRSSLGSAPGAAHPTAPPRPQPGLVHDATQGGVAPGRSRPHTSLRLLSLRVPSSTGRHAILTDGKRGQEGRNHETPRRAALSGLGLRPARRGPAIINRQSSIINVITLLRTFGTGERSFAPAGRFFRLYRPDGFQHFPRTDQRCHLATSRAFSPTRRAFFVISNFKLQLLRKGKEDVDQPVRREAITAICFTVGACATPQRRGRQGVVADRGNRGFPTGSALWCGDCLRSDKRRDAGHCGGSSGRPDTRYTGISIDSKPPRRMSGITSIGRRWQIASSPSAPPAASLSIDRGVEQLAARLAHNQQVGGSNPLAAIRCGRRTGRGFTAQATGTSGWHRIAVTEAPVHLTRRAA